MEKNYTSTRNTSIQALPKQAILEGLASDGGLYVYDDIDQITLPLSDMMKMSYSEMAQVVLRALLFDFTNDEVNTCVKQAYEGKFDDGCITPLVKSGNDHILELFHGPTSAFKDIGLQMLPQLMSVALRDQKDQSVMILTATSGDTGKAALAGFEDVMRVGITVFYPDHGVSEMQRLQMVTQQGKNTCVCALHGNFDDAQSGVKEIFHNAAFQEAFAKQGVVFSSANSINIGRLIPQIVYYFYAYKVMVEQGDIAFGDEVNFCVPTGNFGNVLAGYYAKMMGLPVHRFLVASNANHVLYDFLTTGVYDRNRPFHKTISPSMDILISSNLERLLYYMSGKDADYIAELMNDLATKGQYTLRSDVLQRIQSLFYAGYATDSDCIHAIQTKFKSDGYVLDPHTAVGYHVLKQYETQDHAHQSVLLSTASPYKFSKHVYQALFHETDEDAFAVMEKLEKQTGILAPKGLKELKNLAVRHTHVIEPSQMEAFVENQTKGILL